MVTMATSERQAASMLAEGSTETKVIATAEMIKATKHQLRKVRSFARKVLGSIFEERGTGISGASDPKSTNFSSAQMLRLDADLAR